MLVYEEKAYTTQNMHVCKIGLWKEIANYSFQYKILLHEKWIHLFGPSCVVVCMQRYSYHVIAIFSVFSMQSFR